MLSIPALYSSRSWGNTIIRMVWLSLLIIVIGNSAALLRSQTTVTQRKVIQRVQPKYPEDLRIRGIGGVVRLSVEIAPNGTVRNVSPLGGNPILVAAAVDAVKQWKYATAETTDTIEVKVDFQQLH
ncbi:MAG TPA: energy transducer TonB [Terriglobales bacterium]|nr:energy transducer TonB [Terriglobales bacterium]